MGTFEELRAATLERRASGAEILLPVGARVQTPDGHGVIAEVDAASLTPYRVRLDRAVAIYPLTPNDYVRTDAPKRDLLYYGHDQVR